MINPMDLMKNLSKLQGDFAQMQEKLKEVKAVGSAGGDMVQVVINGHMQVSKVTIDPEFINPKEPSVLQDLLVSAFNDAVTKVKEKMKNEMASMTGMGFPPGFPGL